MLLLPHFINDQVIRATNVRRGYQEKLQSLLCKIENNDEGETMTATRDEEQ